MTRKRLLPIADKSLMTEILPDPTLAGRGHAVPVRERVRARLAQLSESAAALAAAASVAACGESHSAQLVSTPNAGSGGGDTGGASSQAGNGSAGRMTVSESGRSSQATGGRGTGGAGTGGVGTGGRGSGGSGGTGTGGRGSGGTSTGGFGVSTGGYAVVDPLPPPSYVCSMLMLSGLSAQWQSDQSVVVTFQLSGFSFGVTLSSVMATTGVSANVTSAMSPFGFKLQSNSWPTMTSLTLGITCSGDNGGGNPPSTAQRLFTLDTSHPATSGTITVIMNSVPKTDAGI